MVFVYMTFDFGSLEDSRGALSRLVYVYLLWIGLGSFGSLYVEKKPNLISSIFFMFCCVYQ